jgi:L-fuculose-phosphate aldolase
MCDSLTAGAVKFEEEHRRQICAAGFRIHQRGFVASTDGNISVRLDSNRILTSPTCISKGMMTPDDLVVTDYQGRKQAGGREPSSELGMHILIYRRRPDVNAVCHAHPPVATAFAAAGRPLDRPLLTEVVVGLGTIPIAPYATPGSQELLNSLEPYVQNHDAILMANHGVVTYGRDLLTAFLHMETVEHFAQVSLASQLLGKQVFLSAPDVENLLVLRAHYGSRDGSSAETPGQSAHPVASLKGPAEQERISVTRKELEALIEEAIRKDRQQR